MTIDTWSPTTSEMGCSPSPSKSPGKPPILQMATSLHTDQAVKHLLHSYMRTMEDQMSQLGPEDYKHLHASEQGKVIRELGYKVPLSSYASASHKLKEMIREHFDLYSKINKEVNRSFFSSSGIEPLFKLRTTNSKGYKALQNLLLLCAGAVSIISFVYLGNHFAYLVRSLLFWAEVVLFGLGVPSIFLIGLAFVYYEWAQLTNARNDLKDSLEPYFGRNSKK